jgi:hypothetical protein
MRGWVETRAGMCSSFNVFPENYGNLPLRRPMAAFDPKLTLGSTVSVGLKCRGAQP